MQVHFIRHVPFEELGSFQALFNDESLRLSFTNLWEIPIYPEIDQIDLLIILGGTMGVNDDDKYVFLKSEKEFILKAIQADTKIIGICLGAQLLAHLLGGAITQNNLSEIGWFPIRLAPTFKEWLNIDLLELCIDQLQVFHWHGDSIILPNSAINHASSEACATQLFTNGDNIIGIQFHAEATPTSIRSMVDNEGDEIIDAPYIQKKDRILNESVGYKNSEILLNLILKKLID